MSATISKYARQRRPGGTLFYDSAHIPHNVGATMFIAFLIVLEFRDVPTVKQLRARFGMSRATAYRWLQAMRAATEMVTARTATADVPSATVSPREPRHG